MAALSFNDTLSVDETLKSRHQWSFKTLTLAHDVSSKFNSYHPPQYRQHIKMISFIIDAPNIDIQFTITDNEEKLQLCNQCKSVQEC